MKLMDEAPKMTYYARIRSNLTGKILTNWQPYDNAVWYYGICNSLHGGESDYIVEFDIWNNEPGFNAGGYAYHNQNATGCQLSIEPIDNSADHLALFKLGFPYIFSRCYSTNIRDPWISVTIDKPFTKLYGTVQSKVNGVLMGYADHMIIQTKIIMPPNALLENYKRYPFNLVFSYSYD